MIPSNAKVSNFSSSSLVVSVPANRGGKEMKEDDDNDDHRVFSPSSSQEDFRSINDPFYSSPPMSPQLVNRSARIEWKGFLDTKRRINFMLLQDADIHISIFSYLAFFLLGYAPWLTVNALYLQLPTLKQLPPGDYIGAYISVATQLANVGIIGFLLWRKFLKINVYYMVGGILILSVVVSLGIAIAWALEDKLSEKGLTYLILLLTFLAGGSGVLSNVSFWQFAAIYHPNLLTSISIGTAVASVIPSIFAAAQGPTSNQRFTFEVFFLICTLFLCLSLVAFFTIVFTPIGKNYLRTRWTSDEIRKLRTHTTYSYGADSDQRTLSFKSRSPTFGADDMTAVAAATTATTGYGSVLNPNQPTFSEEFLKPFPQSRGTSFRTDQEIAAAMLQETDPEPLPEAKLPILSEKKSLILMFILAATQYFIPSVIIYLTNGFAEADNVFLWVTITGMVGGFLGRLLCLYVNNANVLLLTIAEVVLLSGYFVFGEPIGWATWGAYCLAACSFLFCGIFGFAITMMLKIAASHIDSAFAQNLCLWLGISEQSGALTGATIGLILVISGVFK